MSNSTANSVVYPGGRWFCEIARADERLRRIAEVTVVFPVDEQQIHTDGRRRCLERVRYTEEHRDL